LSTKKITVFASGSGTNFKKIHQAALDNRIPASVTCLICNNPEAGALSYAKKQGIRTCLISHTDFDSEQTFAARLNEVLRSEKPDLIALAGYLKKIPDSVIEQYHGKIINIHPSLLPKYGGKGWYGMKVHQAVIENNEPVSGCTVHYVTTEYDEGPIIAQKQITVSPDDTPETLANKIQKLEHQLYPEVIKDLLSGNSSK